MFLSALPILQHPGRLKLTSSNIVFKNIKTGKLEQFDASHIEKVNWLHRARRHCLKIMLENGNIHRFDGLRESVSYDLLNAGVGVFHLHSRFLPTSVIRNWGLLHISMEKLGIIIISSHIYHILSQVMS